MVHSERFELPTLWFEARCSVQLSYECLIVYYVEPGQDASAIIFPWRENVRLC